MISIRKKTHSEPTLQKRTNHFNTDLIINTEKMRLW